MLDLATGAAIHADLDMKAALATAAQQAAPTYIAWNARPISDAQWRAWRGALPASIAWDVVLLRPGAHPRLAKAAAPVPGAAACALRPAAARRLLDMQLDPRRLPLPLPPLGVYAAAPAAGAGAARRLPASPGFGLVM